MYGQLPLMSDIVGHEGVGLAVKGKYSFTIIKLPNLAQIWNTLELHSLVLAKL